MEKYRIGRQLSVTYSHCGHFLNLLHGVLAAKVINSQSCYKGTSFTFGPCDHCHEVKSCTKFL